ncbi:MAG: DnaJ domain-containing protein [Chitinophagaceae bacterium]|nr:DnaJ domain-containing protein [Chitinophagaceae bacterium]MCW5905180.1 DnaJ domain-containing protein [Chitinophagaceae bacterium]
MNNKTNERIYQKNYYDILQIPPTCSTNEIKKAYRKLALQFHPDINDKHNNLFNNIKEAYEVLVNTETRIQYNRSFLGGDVEEKKIDIDTIAKESNQLLNYTKSYDLLHINYDMIGKYIAQLLQPYYVAIIQYNQDTYTAKEIEKNIIAVIELLPYNQLLPLTEKFVQTFPSHQLWYQKLLKEKRTTMLLEKYAAVLAIIVAVGLCVFIAIIS